MLHVLGALVACAACVWQTASLEPGIRAASHHRADREPPGHASGRPPGRVVAYLAAWSAYRPDFRIEDIPADRVTHVNYAFARVSPAGTCVSGDSWVDFRRPPEQGGGNLAALRRLKSRHPHLRTLISLGGWGANGDLSRAARTAAGRRRLAESCAAFADEHGFDGVDLDWEYPVAGGAEPGHRSDRRNLTLLLADLRRALSASERSDGRRRLLTIAAPVGPDHVPRFDLPRIQSQVDWINLMTYDFTGEWSPRTGLNAPLRSVRGMPRGFDVAAGVRRHLAAGVPRGKLVLGIPFFARGFRAVPPARAGLLQRHGGPLRDTDGDTELDYPDVLALLRRDGRRHWSSRGSVPWLYAPATRTMVSYDDPRSIAIKRRFAEQRGLGGVAVWHLGADDRRGTLLRALTGGR